MNLRACGVNWAPASRSPPNTALERSRGAVERGSYRWMDYLVAELLLNSWSYGLCCCDCSTQLLREQAVEYTSCFTIPPLLNTVVLMVADGLFSLYRLEHKDKLFLGTCSPLSPIPNRLYVAFVDVNQHEKKSKQKRRSPPCSLCQNHWSTVWHWLASAGRAVCLLWSCRSPHLS